MTSPCTIPTSAATLALALRHGGRRLDGVSINPMRKLLTLIGHLAVRGVFAFSIATSGVVAQQFRNTAVPGFDSLGFAIAIADLNRDGFADLLIDHRREPAVRLTDTRGVLGPITSIGLPQLASTTLYEPYVAAVGDIDGDGDRDLIIAAQGWLPLHQLLNDGQGAFVDVTAAHMPTLNERVRELALIDVDLDGDLDLYVARDHQDRLLINDGSGRMSDQSTTRLPVETTRRNVFDLAAGDIDGDGDSDLVLAGATWVEILINNGSGAFIATPGPAAGSLIRDVVFADTDGDGDLDLYYCTADPSLMVPDDVWTNDGRGQFARGPVPSPLPPTRISHRAAVGDWNGDSIPDLVVNSWDFVWIRRGLGGGAFGPTVEHLPIRLGGAFGFHTPRAVDMDGDRDLDLVIGGQVLRNDGSGRFEDATYPQGVPLDGASLVVDLDRDGDEDLAGANLVLVNDGRARFAARPISLGIVPLVAADFDGDGNLDLIGTDTFGDRRIYMALGDGRLGLRHAAHGGLPALQVGEVLAGDWDQDADADLYLAAGRSAGPPFVNDVVLSNDGSGFFTDVTAQWLPRDFTSARVHQGDFDQDGIEDLLLVNGRVHDPPLPNAPSFRILLGRSGGGFARGPHSSVSGGPFGGIAFFDLHSDGDQDIFFGGRQPQVFENSAGAVTNVTASVLALTNVNSYWADPLVGDLDNDGDDDIAFAGHLLLQDANGTLVDSPGRLDAATYRTAYRIADLDRDGDLDALTDRGLFLNFDRQLVGVRPPRIGAMFELELFSRPGYAAGPQAGIIAASAAGALAQSLPGWGLLQLDTATWSLLGFQWLDPSGEGRVSIAVPNASAIVGLEIGIQGAILRAGPMATGLTNALQVSIER